MTSEVKEELKQEVKTPVSNKLDSWLVLGYEKLAREYDLTIEEVKASTIVIKDNKVIMEGKK